MSGFGCVRFSECVSEYLGTCVCVDVHGMCVATCVCKVSMCVCSRCVSAFDVCACTVLITTRTKILRHLVSCVIKFWVHTCVADVV